MIRSPFCPPGKVSGLIRRNTCPQRANPIEHVVKAACQLPLVIVIDMCDGSLDLWPMAGMSLRLLRSDVQHNGAYSSVSRLLLFLINHVKRCSKIRRRII